MTNLEAHVERLASALRAYPCSCEADGLGESHTDYCLNARAALSALPADSGRRWAAMEQVLQRIDGASEMALAVLAHDCDGGEDGGPLATVVEQVGAIRDALADLAALP